MTYSALRRGTGKTPALTQADAHLRVPGKVVRMHRFPTLSYLLAGLVAAAVLASPATSARDTLLPVPAHGVVGVDDAKLSPDYWVARLEAPDAVLLPPTDIAARNTMLVQVDDSMHDLAALPATVDGATVRGLIEALSSRPTRALYDVDGREVPRATIDALMANVALDQLPPAQPQRFGMVVE